MFPSLSAVDSCEEALLFSMDFSVPKLLELVLQDANVCLKKLTLAFLTDCVYWFLTSLKSCISLVDANAERHRMFLCWSRTVKSVLSFKKMFNGACLFKMVRKALLKEQPGILY